jgi:hypothetical protein
MITLAAICQLRRMPESSKVSSVSSTEFANPASPRCDHTLGNRPAVANSCIETFSDHVDKSVVDIDLNLDVGIKLGEAWHTIG